MAIISVRGVTKDYQLGKTIVPALRGVDLEVEKGEFLSIAGPSGSGKTTLLNLVGGVDVPTSGSVRVDGEDTSRLGERALTRLRLELEMAKLSDNAMQYNAAATIIAKKFEGLLSAIRDAR